MCVINFLPFFLCGRNFNTERKKSFGESSLFSKLKKSAKSHPATQKLINTQKNSPRGAVKNSN